MIAVDGKKLRRSHDRQAGKEAIYIVSAWATQNQLVLGQTKVADKSNEITAIPELLRLLDITGCIVTIDALGKQTKIAETIVAGGGDYLLTIKVTYLTISTACLKLMLHTALTRPSTTMPGLSIKDMDGLKFENAGLPKKKSI